MGLQKFGAYRRIGKYRGFDDCLMRLSGRALMPGRDIQRNASERQ
jgi:hypothetical protein